MNAYLWQGVEVKKQVASGSIIRVMSVVTCIRYHLDYSDTELQRMWEWRSPNGTAWKHWFTLSDEQKDQKEYGLFRYGRGKNQAPRLLWLEVHEFCDLILDS